VLLSFYTAWCALSVIKRPNVRPSVCLSVPAAAVAAGGFAAEVGRGQLDIDRCSSVMGTSFKIVVKLNYFFN